jgi:lactam utilization protein B
MTWNYRVCKSVYKDDGYEEVNYEIHEAYYNPDGSIWAVTENAVSVHGENPEEVKAVLEKMNAALEKEVLDLDTFVFAPQQPKEVEEE